jgi:hypothetical protein
MPDPQVYKSTKHNKHPLNTHEMLRIGVFKINNLSHKTLGLSVCMQHLRDLQK